MCRKIWKGYGGKGMTGNEYQRLAIRTINKDLSYHDQLMNSCLGLSGEVGEYTDIVKKINFQNHPLEMDKIQKELGDILWYVALACHVWDLKMDDVMGANIEKLKRRYPEGFRSAKSINRKE